MAEAGALLFGHDREKAEVAARVGFVGLDVDAGDCIFGGVFVEEEFAFGHEIADAEVVDAIVIEDGALDDEGGVDEAGDGRDVGVDGYAEWEVAVGCSVACAWRGRHGDGDGVAGFDISSRW